ncbi:hypothetical protein QNN00_21915 [Bacillus velezensis]|nr:hypothetical protein [Bacillus velezensis]
MKRAFVIVGWVGVKLALYTLAHEELGIIPADVIHSAAWKIIFWAVLVRHCGLRMVYVRSKTNRVWRGIGKREHA